MNTVRIIGGQWRRRLLHFPDSEGLRPTPDRVRETLFNWLGQDMDGLCCLDLFAGSGALGFEAGSRGAAKVVMIEKSRRVAQALAENARLLGATPPLEIVCRDALEYCALASTTFDIIFLDPPYRKGWIDKLAEKLPRLAREDTVLYLEAEQALTGFGDWKTTRSGKAGEVHYHLMRREKIET